MLSLQKSLLVVLLGPMRLSARLERIKAQRLAAAREQRVALEAAGRPESARIVGAGVIGGSVVRAGALEAAMKQRTELGHANENYTPSVMSSNVVPYPTSRRRTKGSSVVVAEASLAKRWDAEFGQSLSSPSLLRSHHLLLQRHHSRNRKSAVAAATTAPPLPLHSRNGKVEKEKRKDEKRVDGIGSSSLAAASAAHVERTRANWKEDVSVSHSLRQERDIDREEKNRRGRRQIDYP